LANQRGAVVPEQKGAPGRNRRLSRTQHRINEREKCMRTAKICGRA